jgi:hypothetical protein
LLAQYRVQLGVRKTIPGELSRAGFGKPSEPPAKGPAKK